MSSRDLFYTQLRSHIDSLLNRQVEELRVQYQTEKKDQDIRLEKQMTVLALEADKKDKDLQDSMGFQLMDVLTVRFRATPTL